MKLYLGVLPYDLKNDRYDFERILISYYMFRTSYSKLKEKINSYDVFVDSGAFSAWSRKTTVDLYAYMDFVREYKLKIYAGLDVIYNPVKTRKNFEIMLEEGLYPIPAFHYGTDIKELKYYKQFPYIALGGLVPLANQRKKLVQWLDYCFSFLMSDIKKGLKVHAFGVLSLDLLMRYPFYSVDGTSWNIGRKWGQMYQSGTFKPKKDTSKFAQFLRETKNERLMSQKNIEMYKKTEVFLTKLWTERGITWKT